MLAAPFPGSRRPAAGLYLSIQSIPNGVPHCGRLTFQKKCKKNFSQLKSLELRSFLWLGSRQKRLRAAEPGALAQSLFIGKRTVGPKTIGRRAATCGYFDFFFIFLFLAANPPGVRPFTISRDPVSGSAGEKSFRREWGCAEAKGTEISIFQGHLLTSFGLERWTISGIVQPRHLEGGAESQPVPLVDRKLLFHLANRKPSKFFASSRLDGSCYKNAPACALGLRGEAEKKSGEYVSRIDSTRNRAGGQIPKQNTRQSSRRGWDIHAHFLCVRRSRRERLVARRFVSRFHPPAPPEFLNVLNRRKKKKTIRLPTKPATATQSRRLEDFVLRARIGSRRRTAMNLQDHLRTCKRGRRMGNCETFAERMFFCVAKTQDNKFPGPIG